MSQNSFGLAFDDKLIMVKPKWVSNRKTPDIFFSKTAWRKKIAIENVESVHPPLRNWGLVQIFCKSLQLEIATLFLPPYFAKLTFRVISWPALINSSSDPASSNLFPEFLMHWKKNSSPAARKINWKSPMNFFSAFSSKAAFQTKHVRKLIYGKPN